MLFLITPICVIRDGTDNGLTVLDKRLYAGCVVTRIFGGGWFWKASEGLKKGFLLCQSLPSGCDTDYV